MPEVYAGPLVRWYRGDFPGGSAPADPPDPADVAALVARWQAAFAPAVGAITWDETGAADARIAAIDDADWAALLADAAAPASVAEAAAQRPREVPGYPLLMATAWIPASFDGILPIGLPDQPTAGALASIDRLVSLLAARRLKRWAAKAPRDEVDAALATLDEIARFAQEKRLPMLIAA